MQDEKTPQAGWVFKPGAQTSSSTLSEAAAPEPRKPRSPANAKVSWSASEYIANPKNASWFMLLAAASAVLAIVVYFATKDVVSVVVIGMLGLILGIFAARQPQVLQYHVDEHGLYIGEKFYAYIGFRSFSVVEEGAFAYVSLMPLKRFMPPLAIHFSPDDEEKIVTTLADYIPYEEHKRDLIDNVSRRLRF